MTDNNKDLDRAIKVAKKVKDSMIKSNLYSDCRDLDRIFSRALISELLRGMPLKSCTAISPYLTLEAAVDVGYHSALADLRAIAGIEEAGT